MAALRTDAWGRVRQSFADQFEPRGSEFIYRKSQKGAGFKVTPAERDRFVESFDNHLTRAKWIIGVGVTVVIGIVVSLSTYRNIDPSQSAFFASIGLAMVPYLAYFRWAWGEPVRELANRIPVAGERSPEEVQRLRFQRITYGQLASAAFGGPVIALVGASHGDLFSGWNRLWLMFGGALVLLAAVQALRKWRFEHENSLEFPTASLTRADLAQPPEYFGWLTNGPLGRYVAIGAILIALAFVFLTPAGKRVAQLPLFWPIAMACLSLWPLFTVVQGYRKGLIEPFARGFYNTYERESQPARFWASMGWNALLGAFLLWAGLEAIKNEPQRALNSTCSDYSTAPQDQLAACNQLLGKRTLSGDERALLTYDRGSAYYRLRDYRQALSDYTEAMRLRPQDHISRYARGLTEERLGDRAGAVIDYGEAIKLRPDYADAYLNRGLIFLDTDRFDQAIADFSRVHELQPNNVWAVADRGVSYAWKRDVQGAQRDFAMVRKLDPSNLALLRGEALLSLNAGNMQAAIASLTAVLELYPDDKWSLRMRAQAYRQNEDFEKAKADIGRLEQVTGLGAGRTHA